MFIDNWSCFWSEKRFAKRKFFARDQSGVHLSVHGKELVMERVLAAVGFEVPPDVPPRRRLLLSAKVLTLLRALLQSRPQRSLAVQYRPDEWAAKASLNSASVVIKTNSKTLPQGGLYIVPSL